MSGDVVVNGGAVGGSASGPTGYWSDASLGTLVAEATWAASGASLAIDTTYASGNSYTFSNTLSGSIGLMKLGPNTLVLAAANNYTGATTISDGTLQVDSGGTVGTLGTGPVIDNGTLAFDRSDPSNDPLTVTQAISGTGGLLREGPGAVKLSGQNTYSGGTAIGAGTIIVGSGTALGGAANGIAIGGGGELDLDGYNLVAGTVTLTDGSIVDSAGGGSLYGIGLRADGRHDQRRSGRRNAEQVERANTVLLSGADSYTGLTTVYSGTLEPRGRRRAARAHAHRRRR